MKILMVNKFLYPKGGAENYMLNLGRILTDHGHQVQYFGLANKKNTVGNAVGAYVTDLDFSAGISANLTSPLRIFYSREARKQIRAVLEDFQPDVLHLNNIQFHLTPSIILEAQAYRAQTQHNLKIIYTAHDYQLICPSHGLLGPETQICEKCLGGNYFHCFRTKCLKNSRAKSALATLDAYLWKWSKAYDYIDSIVCCSHFLKSKLDTQPRFRDKTVVLHNFAMPPREIPAEKAGYVLEFGHLSRDKGTFTLLEAARRMPDTQFLFAGFGPAVEAIQAIPNARYVGFLTGEDLELLIRKASVSVCPSLWYENCPLSVIESQLCGTPVVGSRIGGIPELILPGETGELFTPGDARDLEARLRLILAHPERYRVHSRNHPWQTPDSYYPQILRIYGETHEDL